MENECEELIDQLFSNISDQELRKMDNSSDSSSSVIIGTTQTSRFRTPTTDDQVLEAQKSSVPKTTARATAWAFNLWKEWSKSRETQGAAYPDRPPHLLQLERLNYLLSKFALEVRRKDGIEYPPCTLYQICCGIMRHLRHYCPELNFFTQPVFSGFKKTLDGEMKRLKASGSGVSVKRAEPFNQAEEDILWQQGILGSTSPQTVLDSMVFMCGLYFALRSGQEHRDLQFKQMQMMEKDVKNVWCIPKIHLRTTQEV